MIHLLERDEESPIFGLLRLRELTRAQYRQCGRDANCNRTIYRADPKDGPPILVHITSDVDRWQAGVFACSAHNRDGKRLFASTDEVLALPERDEIWAEIDRLSTLILNISEAGQAAPEALKSGSSESDAG